MGTSPWVREGLSSLAFVDVWGSASGVKQFSIDEVLSATVLSVEGFDKIGLGAA